MANGKEDDHIMESIEDVICHPNGRQLEPDWMLSSIEYTKMVKANGLSITNGFNLFIGFYYYYFHSINLMYTLPDISID